MRRLDLRGIQPTRYLDRAHLPSRFGRGYRTLLYAQLIAGWVVSASGQNARIQMQPTTQPGSNPPSRTITVDEAVAIGLKNSKALGIAAESVRRARGRVNESRTGLLPTVSS